MMTRMTPNVILFYSFSLPSLFIQTQMHQSSSTDYACLNTPIDYACLNSVFLPFLVGPGHVLIAAYDERTCSQLRDVCLYTKLYNDVITVTFFRIPPWPKLFG